LDNRELYDEINALVGAIAKALDREPEAVAKDLESGAVVLSLETDDNGNRFVAARQGERLARVYQGAIRHADDALSGGAG
jgi:frataxin-like iron-binding protein CyaY